MDYIFILILPSFQSHLYFPDSTDVFYGTLVPRGFLQEKGSVVTNFEKHPLSNLQRSQSIKGSRKTRRKENLNDFV